MKPAREAGLLPTFPFGSDFTEVEQRLIPALQMLQEAQRRRCGCRECCGRGLRGRPMPDANAWRGSASIRPRRMSERAYRALVSAALVRSRDNEVPYAVQ